MLEEELSHICTCASLLKGTVVVISDLNLDRLKSYQNKGKLLSNLEAEQGLKCVITKPTRIARKGAITTSTFIDMLLTN